jgi:exopolysaccharide biosynthesis polyprenyl glycosylphosphotransferase
MQQIVRTLGRSTDTNKLLLTGSIAHTLLLNFLFLGHWPMLLRAPWLKERLPLLGLALWDALVVPLSYGLVYLWHHGVWPQSGRAIPGMLLLWLGLSYLIGRYSKASEGFSSGLNRALLLLAVVLLLLTAVLGGSWLLGLPVTVTGLRSQQLPFLALASLASWLGQQQLAQRGEQARPWLLVGEPAELAILQPLLPAADRCWSLAELEACDLASLNGVEGVALSERLNLSLERLSALMQARSEGLQCTSLVSWCEQRLQRVPPELFQRECLLVGEGFQLQPGRFNWRLKRSGDVLVAALLLLLSSPLLLVAALLIRLQDGGPVFYRQKRSGLYGKPFQIAKLRSMRLDAERLGARWAERGDPRITPLGRWLRKWRIDELPQLWAVLRGDMSLIGPRPERPEFEDALEQAIPHYRLRHWLRPGLSGWAQVCHPYGASVEDARQKLSYDLYYLRNANVLLDGLILLKTMRLVALARGAIPLDPSPQVCQIRRP